MAWWAVLHVLPTISCYQPADWGRRIDVDRSQNATPIERLLTESIRFLPRLVAETIEEVADPSPGHYNCQLRPGRPVPSRAGR